MSTDSEDIGYAAGGIRNLGKISVISQEACELLCGMNRRVSHHLPFPPQMFVFLVLDA